jgi:hypothetical protein
VPLTVLRRTVASRRIGARTLFRFARRARQWKATVEQTMLELEAQTASLRTDLRAAEVEIARLRERCATLERDCAEWPLARWFGRAIEPLLLNSFPPASTLFLRRRGAELLILVVANDEAERLGLSGHNAELIMDAIDTHEVTRAVRLVSRSAGWEAEDASSLFAVIRSDPVGARAWFRRYLKTTTQVEDRPYFDRLDSVLGHLDLIDFLAGDVRGGPQSSLPFDQPNTLPPRTPAAPQRRSAVFLHNSYYHFNCISAALRKRGWDAITVSLEAPDSPQQQFYHGEDIRLFDPDPERMLEQTRTFLRQVPERFGAVHFYGMGQPSLFQAHWENVEAPLAIPWDLLELRRHRVVIGYMPSGCLDGGYQSSIGPLSHGVCEKCVWQHRPDVCTDARSRAWNQKLERLCDWVGLEGDYATPERIGPKTVYGPVVTALDPERWHPHLSPPEDMRLEREGNETLIYHAVGNYSIRREGDRDIKGTEAIMEAVERLKAEGLPLRLVFAHQIPSTKVRFVQVQADIVVDQLNYGRYGANAREAMMLGKPTICRLSAEQGGTLGRLRPIDEVPMVHATEETITDALRELVVNKARRLELGRRARAFAIAWHGQDACAARYERVIDSIRAGLSPEDEAVYPPPGSASAYHEALRPSLSGARIVCP